MCLHVGLTSPAVFGWLKVLACRVVLGKREEFSSFVSTAARCVVFSSSYFLHDVYVLSCHRAKTEMSDCCCVCVSCPSPSRDDRMCMPRHSPVVDGEEERREEEE